MDNKSGKELSLPACISVALTLLVVSAISSSLVSNKWDFDSAVPRAGHRSKAKNVTAPSCADAVKIYKARGRRVGGGGWAGVG